MLQRIYTLSPRARLIQSAGRKLLVSDYPLQQFELNDTAWQVLSALAAQAPQARPTPPAEPVPLADGRPLADLVSPVTPALADFLEAKVLQGALQVAYRVTPPVALPTVDIVIPVYANPAGVLRCLEALERLDYPADRFRISVVDDGSPEPVQAALPGAVPPSLVVRWLRLERNQGPASARNAGLRQPWPGAPEGWGTLCAFIDSDCVPQPSWLRALASVLEEESLAAVGGQVVGLRHDGWLARYEAACSSLNLGRLGGPAGDPAHRHPYLPSCNLVVRRSALEQVGGFRAGLRLAEDVDLCWRLRAGGARLFYYPPGAVAHDHRCRLGPFLGRKRAYARSEAWLRQNHPEHFPSSGVRAIRAVAVAAATASLAGIGLGLAVLALGLLAEGVAHGWTQPRLDTRVSLGVFARAFIRRAAAGFAQVCRGAMRATLVLWIPSVLLLPNLWPACTAMLLLGGWAEWQHRRPALRPWEFAAGFFFDALGYSVGKLEGAVKSVFARRHSFLP